MSNGACNVLRNLNLNKHINIEAYKETPEMSRDNCSGIMWVKIIKDKDVAD